MGLAGIFDHDQVILPRAEFQDRIHVRHLAVEMDWDDCPDASAQSFGPRAFPALRVEVTVSFQVAPQLLPGSMLIGGLVDVDEHRWRAALRDGLRGRDEGIRHGDDDVAGTDASRDQRKSQRVGPAADTDAMAGHRRTSRSPLRSPAPWGRR